MNDVLIHTEHAVLTLTLNRESKKMPLPKRCTPALKTR